MSVVVPQPIPCIEDALANESSPITVLEAGGERATLHISRKVLSSIEYFEVLLSDRWAASEPVQLQLPVSCSIGAARQLFLRLYMAPHLRFDWGHPSLEHLLQLAQLADMLMLDSAITEELQGLLRHLASSHETVARLRSYCEQFEVPPWLSELAGTREADRLDVAAAVSASQVSDLMQSVCATDDHAAAKALQRIVLKRSKMSAQHSIELAELFSVVLTSKSHLWEEETVRGSIYKAKDGCGSFFEILVDFARACPAQLARVARASYSPLIGDHMSMHRLGSCAASHYRDVTAGLVAAAHGAELLELLECLAEVGNAIALEGTPALADALARVEPVVQIRACEVLKRLMDTLGAHGSWRLLRSLIGAVVPCVCPGAQIEICCAICDLSVDLQYQLINEPLLRCVCETAQIQLCAALSQLDPRRVQSAASATVLSCVCADARRLLCTALVAEIHALEPAVQHIILAELDDGPINPNKSLQCSTKEYSQHERGTFRQTSEVRPTWKVALCTVPVTMICVGVLVLSAKPLGRLMSRR